MTREYTRRAFASLLGGLGLGAAGATTGLAQPAGDGEVGLDTYTTVIGPGVSDLEFNPYADGGTTVEAVADAVFERFARHDLTDGEFVLVGLEDWSVDGDAVTLTVREGLTWHDHEPVTAADLEAKLLLDETADVGLGPYVEGVSTVGDRTVEVTLTEPFNPRFVKHKLADRRIDAPRSVYEQFLDGPAEDLRSFGVGYEDVVGCGPFRVRTGDDPPDPGVLYTRRFVDHPDADDLAVQRYDFLPSELLGDRLEAVDHGVVDGGVRTFASPDRVAASDDLVEVRVPNKWGYGLVPNHEHEHVGRRAVRQAIMHVIDRDAVARSAGPRTKEPAPIPTAIPVDDQERWLGDAADDYETYGVSESRTDRAAELLRDAGYELADGTWVDESGAAIELPVTVPEGWRDWVAATEAVVEQLRAFGFRTEVDARPFSELLDGAWPDGDFVLTAGSWLPGRDAAFPGAAFEHQFAETVFGYLHGYPGGGDGSESGTVTVPERDGDGELTVRPADLGDRMTRATDRSEAVAVAREGAWVANRDLPMLPVVEKRQQLFYDGDRVELPPIDDGAYRFWLPTAWLLRTGKLRTTGDEAEPVVVDGTISTDPDDDGIYEDLNGNGQVDYADVVTLFNNMDDDAVQIRPEPYDFNGNGEVDYADLVSLFQEV